MSIPRWLIDKRHKTCAGCDRKKQCAGKFSILEEAPKCPKNILPSLEKEISEKAWPSGAPKVSGCCDSAKNYIHPPASAENPSKEYLARRANRG